MPQTRMEKKFQELIIIIRDDETNYILLWRISAFQKHGA